MHNTPQGTMAGANEQNGAPAVRKTSSGLVYPHLSDLQKKVEYNINLPISSLLHEADRLSRQAETHADFGRIHLGLQDYYRAYELTIDVIPRHRDFVTYRQRDQFAQGYRGLQRRLQNEYLRFEGVKMVIQQNNARHGTQKQSSQKSELQEESLASKQSAPVQAAQSSSTSFDGGGLQTANGSPKKPKPEVQRKPTFLLGKSLGHSRSQSEQISREPSPALKSNDALEERFARLRTSSGVKQHASGNLAMPDPSDYFKRNAPLDKPAGPRPLPGSTAVPPRPGKIPLDIAIPDLPRPPDAIYSPIGESRNKVPPRPAHRPALSSNVRRPTAEELYGRSSLDGSRTPPQRCNARASAPVSQELSAATKVTAEQLKDLMGKHKILFVDVRVRSQFDEGHIMSHSIICVEPAALRTDMSAQDLESALVLSPDAEMTIFRNRKSYDFIVYYDQSSTSNLYANATSNVEEEFLRNFSKAVYDYDYNNSLKCPPKLLVGGLDAWIDLMGSGSLAISQTYNSITPQTPRALTRPSYRTPSGTHYQSRLALDEEEQWKSKLSAQDTGTGFAGRFPDLETFESKHATSPPRPYTPSQSMTDMSRFNAEQRSAYRQYDVLRTPTRPSVAVHKQSYKGVTEDYGQDIGSAASGYQSDIQTISSSNRSKGHTGLYNLGNMCYLNSIIQAFSNTKWFREYLINGEFVRQGPPPRKEGELTDPPQIMTKNLKLLFDMIWDPRSFEFLKPQTLKNYIYTLCRATRRDVPSQELFGGPRQQDAMEFLAFMLDVLDDENNRARNVPLPRPLTAKEEERLQREGYGVAIPVHKKRYTDTHQSFLSQNLAVSTMQACKCGSCGYIWTSHKEPTFYLPLNLPQRGKEARLQEILSVQYNAEGKPTEITDDFNCERCTKTTGKKVKRQACEVITVLPDTLIFALVRNVWTERGDQSKNELNVRFPLEDLDMNPYFYRKAGQKTQGERGTRYRCYAVVQHHGKHVNEGHYTTMVRDGNGEKGRDGKAKWWHFNDQKVSEIDSNETQKNSSYLLFYERL